MRPSTRLWLALALAVVAVSVSAAFTSPSSSVPAADSTHVIPNNNKVAAGKLQGRVLSVRLVARETLWKPEGAQGPEIPVYAFAEEGAAPRIPGPLLRVPAGTEIRIAVRNALPSALRIVGLQSRPASKLDTLELAPGAKAQVKFTAGEPGTYLYSARTIADSFAFGQTEDGQLSGAIVVDSAGNKRGPGDRVFVIGLWTLRDYPLSVPIEERPEVLVINGLSWPHTERVTQTVGDTIRWRVLNATRRTHPMHLHGFYFRVDGRGTQLRDTAYAVADRRLAVTEVMRPGTSMAMVWSPHTPGNWLFHCHVVVHISGHVTPRQPGAPEEVHSNHAMQGMSGLVLGINVHPKPGAPPAPAPAAPRRVLRLFVTEKPGGPDQPLARAFVLQEGDREPAGDSVRLPGSTLVLTRGEPTAITVINRMHAPVNVHWHGIELDSYYDGVGGWSGAGPSVAPAIAPGDSFVVRVTPRRAGTFMYHTHLNETRQLGAGLYGALLVLEPGEARDTLTDRVFVMASSAPGGGTPPNFNGAVAPTPLELHAETRYRLRFINIAQGDLRVVRLLADTVVQRWRPIAKDGATLPETQATVRPARAQLAVGETADFEFTTPAAQDATLEMTSMRGLLPPLRVLIPVKIR